MRYLKSLLNIISVAAILVSCSKDGGSGSGGGKGGGGNLPGGGYSYIYPDDGTDWAVADPEKYNFSQDGLDKVTEYIAKTDVTCMMVVAGGEQIYKYGYNSEISYIASCRKSVLAILYGKYATYDHNDDTKPVKLDYTVGQMMSEFGMKDDVQGLTEQEKTATLYHLITARSGIYHPASNAGDTENKPIRDTYQPGEYYLYNNWDFNFAGAALERLVKGSYSNKEIYTILQEDLAFPIGMADWDFGKQRYGGTWTGNNAKSYYPAYHIYISTRDMARIGYLMLRNGKWKDKQVISEEWVEQMLSVHSTNDEVGGYFSYGYMWWLFDDSYTKNNPAFKDAYMARGSGGQYILIMPALDLVVAWKTNTSAVSPHNSSKKRSTSYSQFWKAMGLVLDAYTEDLTRDESTGDDADIEDNLDF